MVGKESNTLVRQSAKREHIPEVLDVGEISSLLTELQYPYKAMVLLAAATGLRASELLGLQWQDIDFDLLQINLNRGVVHQVVGGSRQRRHKSQFHWTRTWHVRFLNGGICRLLTSKATGSLPGRR